MIAVAVAWVSHCFFFSRVQAFDDTRFGGPEEGVTKKGMEHVNNPRAKQAACWFNTGNCGNCGWIRCG